MSACAQDRALGIWALTVQALTVRAHARGDRGQRATQERDRVARGTSVAQHDRRLAREGAGDVKVTQRERPPAAIEDLQYTDRALGVDQRRREDGPGHVTRRLGDRPIEARIDGDVGDGELLARRERIPGDPGAGVDLEADHVAARRAGAGDEHEAVTGGVVRRDRSRLRVEHGGRGGGDRRQQGVVARRRRSGGPRPAAVPPR